MLRLVSFNINGIRARPHQLEALYSSHAPVLVGLQEIKVDDPMFPHDTFPDFKCYHHGQKGHYGVAFSASKDGVQPTDIERGMPWDEEDAQKRLIAARLPLDDGRELIVINGYFPNGENNEHPTKYPAKRKFYSDILKYLKERMNPTDLLVVMGDLNIAPLDNDIGIGETNRKRWLRDGHCSFLPEEREWLQALADWGLVDSFRHLHPDIDDRFSWFDYRSRGFDDNPKRGLRIDQIWVSHPLVEFISGAGIDYDIRAMEKPSDHAPIWTDLNLELRRS